RRYASWGYDCQGRATLSQQGDLEHADKVTITYDSPAAGQATLVHTMDDSNPNSILTSTSIFSFSTVEGTAKGTSITNAAGTPAPCRDCGDTGTYTYDPNGNITSRTDFSENKTCYGYDTARNLETRRIEGLASTEDCAALIGATSPALTPPARMISTEWHADYRLPLRIAEPKRLTTFTYGAPTDASPGNRGNVLTRILKATTDENGALGFGATTVGTQRKWTYTYNSNGFVLTEN